MKNILFGSLTKGQYQISVLDGIMAYIEIFVGLFLLLYIPSVINDFIDKWKKKKGKKDK